VSGHCGLRRGDHYAERLRLDLERFAEANKADEERALELCLDETKQWPDMEQAFRDAFALLKQQKKESFPLASQPPVRRKAGRIKPNQTKSNQFFKRPCASRQSP
jgi:hypothetical protein